MQIAGAAVLIACCVFILYMLVKFHIEATRPQKRSNRTAGLIVLRKKLVAHGQGSAGGRKSETEESRRANPPMMFPAGLRRLSMKRAARS